MTRLKLGAGILGIFWLAILPFVCQRLSVAHSRLDAGVTRQPSFRPWLSGDAGAEILRSAADDCVRFWPVSRRVNRTGSGGDDPTLIEEVARELDISPAVEQCPFSRLGLFAASC
jgi:hypothetical protein